VSVPGSAVEYMLLGGPALLSAVPLDGSKPGA
jgi:hypothetical protein